MTYHTIPHQHTAAMRANHPTSKPTRISLVRSEEEHLELSVPNLRIRDTVPVRIIVEAIKEVERVSCLGIGWMTMMGI